jgi:hypothetical protein
MSDGRIVQEWLRYSKNDMIAACYMFFNANPRQTEISVSKESGKGQEDGELEKRK